MFHLIFTIEGLPKTTNANARRHWRALQSESIKWKRQVACAIGSNRPIAPLHKAKLVLTRVSSSEPDYDGLVSSFKHCIDSLVECGVLVNDKMSAVGIPEYKWVKGRRNQGHIIVEVVETLTYNRGLTDDVLPTDGLLEGEKL